MRKSLFIFSLMVLSALGASGAITADWKIYMPFDAWPTDVVETPGRVYFTARTYELNKLLSERSSNSKSLFYYDKKGDEIVSVNARNQASGNAVACIAYNFDKKYLLVVYTDCNIDFIYEDGRIFNLPALKATSLPGKKAANSITFDSPRNRAYVATSFGYLCLNDEKHEVAESRNYGEEIESIARCGENIVLTHDGEIYFAPAASQRFSFSDYTLLPGTNSTEFILPLEGSNFLGYATVYNSPLDLYTFDGSTYSARTLESDPQIFGAQQIAGGAYRITGNVKLFELTPQGTLTFFTRPEADWRSPAASLNGTEIWCLSERKGLRSYNKDHALTRDFMRPNAPATYISTDMVYHPAYGLLAGSNGYDIAYFEFSQTTPPNVSAIKGGFWKEFGPNYTNPSKLANSNNYTGVSVDPKNSNYVYRGSTLNGLMRINLANPNDILVFANPSNPNARTDAFVEVAPDQSWNVLCRFTPPQFTSDGTMWTLYNNHAAGRAELWYWPAADRAACTSAASYRPMKKIPIPKFQNSNNDVMIALSKNKNMFVMGGLQGGGTFMVYDHNGTPDFTGDDRYVLIDTPYDQDGGSVSFLQVNALAEDPVSGTVYIMSQRGLYTINPATVFENPNLVNRIKVARNDGTNLADYLLDGINVNHMGIDGEGRKWFSTSNGLVCTSSDCRQILGEFTTENSYLPDNNVYATCYNPENNSIMVGTGGGLVEMFPSGSGNSSTAEESGMRVYPNPVEPDYYGWVRIDNVADGSLVKITDSTGGVVKELGPVQGGSVEWDVSGLNNTRVATGVYYVMVSPGSNGGNTQISKILVLN